MKKQILSIGKALSKTEQKAISGGAPDPCIPTQLPAPPVGCYYRRVIGTCNYILLCDDIFPF
ncbi:hypothetical protein [Kordia sp.]|uniref:hypothetical protein n=1 Tax=Kordia sp. TaxID=1965332 RepID=UPI003D6B68C1